MHEGRFCPTKNGMGAVMVWIGIAFCLSQAAVFSGLNLGLFSMSRLRLEVSAKAGDPLAFYALALRRNANSMLATILWGNTAMTVLLALLSKSIMVGASAFVFATAVITLLGEIFPQAFFIRHALRMVVLLAPVLRVYQFLLYPVARPTGWLLDRMVGPEGIPWFSEQELQRVLMHQSQVGLTELGHVETTGAINFLALDDLPVGKEGEPLDPRSIIPIKIVDGRPVFPPFARLGEDPFLRQLEASGKKWVVLVDDVDQEPRFVLNVHYFLRAALLGGIEFNPVAFCHRPLIVHDSNQQLGQVLVRLTVQSEHFEDDVVDKDIILVWSDSKRIITGSDLLGRLLRGITRREPSGGPPIELAP